MVRKNWPERNPAIAAIILDYCGLTEPMRQYGGATGGGDVGGCRRGGARREAKGWRGAVGNGVWTRLGRPPSLPPASPGLHAGFLAACPPPILNGVLRAGLWGGRKVGGRTRGASGRGVRGFFGVFFRGSGSPFSPPAPLPPYCQHDAYLVREPVRLWPTAWFIRIRFLNHGNNTCLQ